MEAYLDTVAGLVKCKIIGKVIGHNRLVVKVTAKKSFLKQGAIMHYSKSRVILRGDAFRKGGNLMVKSFTASDASLKEYKLIHEKLVEA